MERQNNIHGWDPQNYKTALLPVKEAGGLVQKSNVIGLRNMLFVERVYTPIEM